MWSVVLEQSPQKSDLCDCPCPPSALLNYLFLHVAKSTRKSLIGGHCKILKTEVCKTEVWPDLSFGYLGGAGRWSPRRKVGGPSHSEIGGGRRFLGRGGGVGHKGVGRVFAWGGLNISFRGRKSHKLLALLASIVTRGTSRSPQIPPNQEGPKIGCFGGVTTK